MRESHQAEPTYVLGLNENHDASAALCVDGKIVSAISLERVSRIKHHGFAVRGAVQYVLEATGIQLSDLRAVVSCIHGAAELDRDPIESEFKRELREIVPIYHVHPSHHALHAISTACTSAFAPTAVMVWDGLGSEIRHLEAIVSESEITTPLSIGELVNGAYHEAESHFIADGPALKALWRRFSNHHPYDFEREDISLGRLYSYASKFVFETRDDAGKLMALAAHGIQSDRYPSFVEVAGHALRVSSERLREFSQRHSTNRNPLVHADLAHRVQTDLETAMLHAAKRLRAESGLQTLCLAGGVALNCQANTLLTMESGFHKLHVVPAPGDDGIAIGAALFGYHQLLGHAWHPVDWFDPYLGRTYDDDDIERALLELPVPRSQYARQRILDQDELFDLIARRLLAGHVVFWFQGGSEFGPRSLGNRSILANPSLVGMRDLVNRQVKNREAFRPLAPSILEERTPEFFAVPDGWNSPYMLFTASARPRQASRIAEVLHVDGSARLQTVTERQNRPFTRLIRAFEQLSGLPLLLNTSLNDRGEPIAETPRDAIHLFLRKPVTTLVMNQYVVTRNNRS